MILINAMNARLNQQEKRISAVVFLWHVHVWELLHNNKILHR